MVSESGIDGTTCSFIGIGLYFFGLFVGYALGRTNTKPPPPGVHSCEV